MSKMELAIVTENGRECRRWLILQRCIGVLCATIVEGLRMRACVDIARGEQGNNI